MRLLALTPLVGPMLLGGALASACGQPYDASDALEQRDAEPEANAPADAGADANVDVALPTDADADADADADVDAGPCITCERLVFVTSALYTGNLAGLAGADAKCNERAMFSLYPAIKNKTFLAWLSTAAMPAENRHVHATGPYKRADGLVVAGSYGDLVDAVLAKPIALDELGNATSGKVWTGTNPTGTSSNATCNGWMSTSGLIAGQTGKAEAEDLVWTDDSTTSPCDITARLYCIER